MIPAASDPRDRKGDHNRSESRQREPVVAQGRLRERRRATCCDVWAWHLRGYATQQPAGLG